MIREVVGKGGRGTSGICGSGSGGPALDLGMWVAGFFGQVLDECLPDEDDRERLGGDGEGVTGDVHLNFVRIGCGMRDSSGDLVEGGGGNEVERDGVWEGESTDGEGWKVGGMEEGRAGGDRGV